MQRSLRTALGALPLLIAGCTVPGITFYDVEAGPDASVDGSSDAAPSDALTDVDAGDDGSDAANDGGCGYAACMGPAALCASCAGGHCSRCAATDNCCVKQQPGGGGSYTCQSASRGSCP
jgi:hypothetical protein